MPLGLKLSIVAWTLAACAMFLSLTGHVIGLLFSSVSIIVSVVSVAMLGRDAYNRRKQ